MSSSLPQNTEAGKFVRGGDAGEIKNMSLNNVSDTAVTMKMDTLPTTKLLLPEKRIFEDINQSAEKFIKNFRQELQIQRLESIASYEEMLARGT